MSENTHITKLSNSPLQEVIFELFLENEVDSQGNPTEEKFELAQGIFARAIAEDFPIRVSIKLSPNLKVYPRISFQFWKGEQQWPVVQFGPGILTVNDTDENYEWTNYFPLIQSCIDSLENSYEEDLKISKVVLKYIDAIELDDATAEKKIQFINNHFNINIVNNFTVSDGRLVGLNINQSFLLEDRSQVNFSITDGKSKKNLPAIVWQQKISTNSISNKDEVISWLTKGHEVVSKLFKDTITKDFYEHFNKNN